MLKIRDLSFNYNKKPTLFNNLELDLINGNIYGLLGKNGAGKTTLIKLITGLLFPSAGYCKMYDLVPSNRDPNFLKEVFFLPESFSSPDLKIKEYQRRYSKFYPKFSDMDFIKYLTNFELNLLDGISNLSMGQKKKVFISFGLATNCKLLIFDEPTNGLDIPAKSIFRKMIASSINEERLFIISTHQIRDMKHLIDPIIILDDGKILLNKFLYDIENLISQRIVQNEPNEVLYYEKTIGGYSVIEQKSSLPETEIDLEILFNAVTSKNEKLLKVLDGGIYAE